MTAPAPTSALPRRSTRNRGPSAAARRRRLSSRPVLVLLVAVVSVLLVRAYVVEPIRIPSASMSPTLRPGEHVAAEKVSMHVRAWQRGDIVVLTSPADGELLIKRIVGVGGDTVGLRDGRLFVNGDRVNEPYTDPDAIDSVYYGPVHVPDGEVLVMGDNRGDSVDSRSFGTVPESNIEGRVAAVLWPPDAFGIIHHLWNPS